MDEALAAKLREVDLDPADFGDPSSAWRRLHDRLATRATLLDRYALEAAARGIAVDELPDDDRSRMTLEVLEAHTPGFEIVGGSERATRDAVEIVEPDPGWASRYDAWRRRLEEALGDAARRIEHIGSTSVPGLAAKPVIDIQVSVGDIADEQAYVPAIERLGVALRSRDALHRYFRPAGDQPREVQIHVCTAGSAWEREHLLFRDYLRSQPRVAAEYAAMKRLAAKRHRTDRIAYNEAKTEFILAQLARAEAWALANGWQVRPPSRGRRG